MITPRRCRKVDRFSVGVKASKKGCSNSESASTGDRLADRELSDTSVGEAADLRDTHAVLDERLRVFAIC